MQYRFRLRTDRRVEEFAAFEVDAATDVQVKPQAGGVHRRHPGVAALHAENRENAVISGQIGNHRKVGDDLRLTTGVLDRLLDHDGAGVLHAVRRPHDVAVLEQNRQVEFRQRLERRVQRDCRFRTVFILGHKAHPVGTGGFLVAGRLNVDTAVVVTVDRDRHSADQLNHAGQRVAESGLADIGSTECEHRPIERLIVQSGKRAPVETPGLVAGVTVVVTHEQPGPVTGSDGERGHLAGSGGLGYQRAGLSVAGGAILGTSVGLGLEELVAHAGRDLHVVDLPGIDHVGRSRGGVDHETDLQGGRELDRFRDLGRHQGVFDVRIGGGLPHEISRVERVVRAGHDLQPDVLAGSRVLV